MVLPDCSSCLTSAGFAFPCLPRSYSLLLSFQGLYLLGAPQALGGFPRPSEHQVKLKKKLTQQWFGIVFHHPQSLAPTSQTKLAAYAPATTLASQPARRKKTRVSYMCKKVESVLNLHSISWNLIMWPPSRKGA